MKREKPGGSNNGTNSGKKIRRPRRKPDLNLNSVRAALSNNHRRHPQLLLYRDAVDGRLPWARRLRDLIADHVSDLGGEDYLSTAELVLVKRASMITLQLEMMEVQFAKQDGVAVGKQLEHYQRALNTLRRTLESLGLQRRQRDVTPSLGDVLRADLQRQQAEDAEEVSTVDG